MSSPSLADIESPTHSTASHGVGAEPFTQRCSDAQRELVPVSVMNSEIFPKKSHGYRVVLVGLCEDPHLGNQHIYNGKLIRLVKAGVHSRKTPQ